MQGTDHRPLTPTRVALDNFRYFKQQKPRVLKTLQNHKTPALCEKKEENCKSLLLGQLENF